MKESKTFSLTAELSRQSQSITVYITSESIAGVTVSNTYKPTVNAKEYPTPDTRPQTSVEVMLEGFEEDPDFWNMGPDDDDVPVKLEKSQDVDWPSRQQDSPARPTKTTQSNTARSANLHLGLKRLPNGNYECNHTCKDKSKCRHMW